MDKDNWIITENHHEPIIKKDKYDEVQKILDRKILNKLIDIIYIFDDKKIEIKFKS